jgi:hypothetical protein
MGKWEPCGRAFITGDVIRWVEPVWMEAEDTKNREGPQELISKPKPLAP